MKRLSLVLMFFALTVAATFGRAAETYPGTESLTIEGDVAAQMVAGIDKFLLDEIDKSVARRAKFWDRDLSSAEAYNKSIEPNRRRLAHILGVRDERVKIDSLELMSTTARPALVGKGDGYKIFAVRWPVIRNIHGEGLLLIPDDKEKIVADVIAIPDADQTPEQIAGLAEGVPAESQFARRLAESGCRVVVPVLISREMKRRAPPGQAGRANLSNREYLYRSAFELGRHIIGYELQKVFAVVDWFDHEQQIGDRRSTIDNPIGVIGYGEGGMLALYAAALDTRIDAACVSGYFGPREGIWEQPIDRSVFGLLEQFGDAELATMVAPRNIILECGRYPEVALPGEGGAPARLTPAGAEDVHQEHSRADAVFASHQLGVSFPLVMLSVRDRFASDEAVGTFLVSLTNSAQRAAGRRRDPAPRPAANAKPKSGPEWQNVLAPLGSAPQPLQKVDVAARQQRQIEEINQHNQWLLGESPFVRAEFMKKLDTSSLKKYNESVEWYRDFFRNEVVGHFDYELLPFNARSRKAYDEEKWTGYEVMLDVFPNVFAYGILCVPKDVKPDEKRPVVVCQHGLEGRPQDVVTGNHGAYHDFAAKLAERGFITFAPQNIYIGHDDFRTLQRKAYPLKKTLFSIMVPQHQQIVNWLKTLPHVDPQRIAFYGLSYGGKSAMRIPPLVTDYCLSICSADFNEWVLKNASTRENFSYVWTGEYEIFEFDLGSTFNYAEMAALICPRPFMVERGHFDGVGEDHWVAHEFAKVRNLYQARLGIGDRCEIEWFVGPHTINGQGTFDFLHKHLNWPKP